MNDKDQLSQVDDKPKRQIFVFGSNLAGRHGAGSALEAVYNHGAIHGKGSGIQGNSYAIPTKDHALRVMSLDEIERYVQGFITYAAIYDDCVFNVVKIGCGLAGYREDQIAPMFKFATKNVNLPKGWRK